MENEVLQKHDHHIYQSLEFEFSKGNPQYLNHVITIDCQAYSLVEEMDFVYQPIIDYHLQ